MLKFGRLVSYLVFISSIDITMTSGDFMFVSADGTAVLKSAPKDGYHVCWLCGAQERLQKMRDHVVHHLASAKLNYREKLLNPVRFI
jgi:hypothetical protein